MWINVLKGDRSYGQILLRDVLYTLNLGLTLVSISKVAATGCTAMFKDSHLKIFDSSNKLLAEILVSNRLYCIEHRETAIATVETITVDELHCWMGHVAKEVAQALVVKGMVKGLAIDNSQAVMTCDSCEFTKMTQKLIQCKRDDSRAT
jgi:hypothetical protein